jgi:general secretion pathway protein K
MVLAALAVMAFVAQRFAQRNDELRRNALNFDQYAEARASTAGAVSATIYWNATRPLMPAGRGMPDSQLRQDGQRYTTTEGAFVAVQDFRGLLAVNGVDRPILRTLLIQDGVPLQRAQAMIDVLDDYIDTDNLKRLNGAERGEYQTMELPGPRNDWLLSTRELEGLPLWRDEPTQLARWTRWFSSDVGHPVNPSTAPLPVLRALLPTANPPQLQLLLTLRRSDQLRDGRTAQSLLGLPLDSDDYVFAPGNESRITAWAPGLPRALEYNVRLIPAGELGPWVITEQHSITRLYFTDEAPPALPFPLALGARLSAASSPAP